MPAWGASFLAPEADRHPLGARKIPLARLSDLEPADQRTQAISEALQVVRGTRRLLNGTGVVAGHAGDGFDAALDIAREATLLFSGCGDGIEAVADFGHRAVGRLQDAGDRGNGRLAGFEVGETFLDAAANSN